MPQINGFDLFKQLRKNKKTKNVPVIVVSAATDEENVVKMMKMGAVDFIKKPIDLEYLVDKVESILHKEYN